MGNTTNYAGAIQTPSFVGVSYLASGNRFAFAIENKYYFKNFLIFSYYTM